MSGQPLCIRTFAETMRERMSKNAHIKTFDADKKSFQSDTEAKNRDAVNLSQVHPFYELLLKSVLYVAIENETADIPDVDATMASQLKNGKWEIHGKIKEIAQDKGAKAIVTDYFAANLVPNIPSAVLQSVLDDIDALIKNAPDIKTRKKNALKQGFQQRKSDASYLAEVWLLAICNGVNVINSTPSKTQSRASKDPFEGLKYAEELISAVPAPPEQIIPPVQPLAVEQTYIIELYAAYGDKEGIAGFNESHLTQYEEYSEDLNDRRIDYFAADSIRRGVMEMYSGSYANQFEVLKNETLTGIKDTSRRTFPNGYERMLGVMEQATRIQVARYILSASPDWINNSIRKGVCHFLVSDKKLKWVKP